MQTNLRGLYASIDIPDSNTPLISIPNKLIVSPLHIRGRKICENHAAKATYGDIFKEFPEVFDPDHPLEPSADIIGKMVNIWGEYMEITLFLVIERFKGHACGHSTIADNGNTLLVVACLSGTDGHAERGTDGCAGMTHTKGVVFTFTALGEAGQRR